MNINRIQLEQDEQILLQVRKHWFVISMELLGMFVVALLPYFAYVAVNSHPLLSELYQAHVPFNIVLSLYSAWLLIVWMTSFNIWNNYYLDVWTFTNKRLIAVDQRGFFFRTTASFRLNRLQDVEITVNGIIATFLNFGSLEIQTAGEERHFKANGLPNPVELKSLILKHADNISREHSDRGSGM